MTTDLVLLGICMGLGLLLAAAGLRMRRSSLLAGTSRHGAGPVVVGHPAQTGTPTRVSAVSSIGTSLGRLGASDARISRQARDLAVTDRTVESHGVVIAVTVLVGLTVPTVLAGLLTTVGVHIPAGGVLVASGVGFAGGVLSPAIELHRSANEARERFLRGLSLWLELVALAQAGGMGVEGALEAAGRISTDPAFWRIRQALERARHSGATPWEALGRLGAEIGVDELGELAASLSLAGIEGARIRASLTAKSESLRRKQMSRAESRANSTTERLFLPSIVLMLGFLVFLMYPAGVSLAHLP
jgi:Flp pilus assembly protein TadB